MRGTACGPFCACRWAGCWIGPHIRSWRINLDFLADSITPTRRQMKTRHRSAEEATCRTRKRYDDMAVAVALPLALSPQTPCDVFAALALSPTLAGGQASAVPALHLSPPTPTATATGIDVGGLENDELPSPFYTPTSSLLSTHFGADSAGVCSRYRPLALSEAKQLGVLLVQQLSPVRHDLKGITRESISLADKLHDAGVRWDKHRRVMGVHLRGIWEEGQRVGNGRAASGHRAME